MRQPSKNNKSIKRKPKKKRVFVKSANSSELDGSGLEAFFRNNYLDKIGVEYIQQFEAKSIGRFYDFLIKDHRVIIECDGTFFHSDPRFYNKNLSTVQIRNKKVDKIKDKWAAENGFILLRFWEYDIRNNPNLVLDILNENITKKII